MQQIMDRILLADLPVDMQERSDQILLDAAEGFKSCADTATAIFWQNKICNIMQHRNAMMAIKALETEAAARTTTVAPDTADTV